MRRARDDGRPGCGSAQLGGAELMVIDELGFLPLDADGARLLFQAVSGACEAQSVVFTTNLEFSRWGSVFGDDQMTAAVTGRVVHHGRLLRFRGESHRVRVTWHAYAGAMLAGASPGACASAAGVSLRTSFFMRHRLCEVMACTTPAPGARRGCRVLVDGFAVPDSLG